MRHGSLWSAARWPGAADADEALAQADREEPELERLPLDHHQTQPAHQTAHKRTHRPSAQSEQRQSQCGRALTSVQPHFIKHRDRLLLLGCAYAHSTQLSEQHAQQAYECTAANLSCTSLGAAAAAHMQHESSEKAHTKTRRQMNLR